MELSIAQDDQTMFLAALGVQKSDTKRVYNTPEEAIKAKIKELEEKLEGTKKKALEAKRAGDTETALK